MKVERMKIRIDSENSEMDTQAYIPTEIGLKIVELLWNWEDNYAGRVTDIREYDKAKKALIEALTKKEETK